MNNASLYIEIIQLGYLQPRTYIDAMTDYFGQKGTIIADPFCAIRNWMRREKSAPSLSEEERQYLATFLRAMDPQGVCRFCDLLGDFELTPTQAILTMKLPEAGIHALDNWLAEHMDVRQLQSYRRAIVYRKEG